MTHIVNLKNLKGTVLHEEQMCLSFNLEGWERYKAILASLKPQDLVGRLVVLLLLDKVTPTEILKLIDPTLWVGKHYSA